MAAKSKHKNLTYPFLTIKITKIGESLDKN